MNKPSDKAMQVARFAINLCDKTPGFPAEERIHAEHRSQMQIAEQIDAAIAEAVQNARPQAPQSAVELRENLAVWFGKLNRSDITHAEFCHETDNLIQSYAQQVADAQCAPLVEALKTCITSMDGMDYERDKDNEAFSKYHCYSHNIANNALDAYHKAKGE